MRALVFPPDRIAIVTDVVTPVIADDEVLIRVRAAGVCHTDLEILRGNYPATLPVTPGHEFAGTIAQVGRAVQGLTVGQSVAVDPLVTCGNCRNCRSGHPNLCTVIAAYGAELNGGLAEFTAVKATNVCPVGDLPFAIAALGEPFACALHGVERANAKQGQRALVFGAGPIGLLLLVALRSRGVHEITVVDVFDDRLTVAKTFGATSVEIAGDDLPARLGEREFDLIIDATGRPSVAQESLKYLHDAGTLLIFGVCPPGSAVTVDPHEVYARELTIMGSFSLAHNLAEAIEALQHTDLDMLQLITDRFSLDDAAAALGRLGLKDSLKVHIHMDARDEAAIGENEHAEHH
jgi:2-desacetyl-2-hydroxyethyl bacteriochlorophyllide A dehydrogenase